MYSGIPEHSDRSMKGRISVVTGGTSGIGKETAIGLSRLGSHVIIVGRSREKCQDTVEEIESITDNVNISFETADLSSMESVRRLAETISSKNPRIHVLVNNAGGVFSSRMLTADGYESTMALGYLSPFLLTHLLLPSLMAADRARIVNIGSSVHKSGLRDFNFSYPGKYAPMKAYATSKLMMTMFSYALSRHLAGTGVSVSLVQPGFVATNLGKNSGSGLLSASFGIMRPFQISAEEAAKTPVYLASTPDPAKINGRCYSRMKPVETSSTSYDKKLQDELWNRTSEILGLRDITYAK